MKLAFVVERPTQFEAPFYRHAAADPEHALDVYFTAVAATGGSTVFDPELGRTVEWGIDLVGGYPWSGVPVGGPARFLGERFATARYDLVITNGYVDGLYLRAAWAARKTGSTTALRLDSVPRREPLPGRLARRALYALVLRRTYHGFLATGSLTRDYLHNVGVPDARIGRFPYAIDVDAFRAGATASADRRAAVRAELGVPAGSRVVLSLCKFSRREAPWDLVRAFAGPNPPGASLVLAGDGPERAALAAMVQSEGLSQVVFPGYVPYTRLPEFYAAADLFVHAVAEERWGVSVGEALACGLPVVASNRVGAAVDLVEEGRNGFRYCVGDWDDLSVKIAAALALDRTAVDAVNHAILARWDYEATWRGLLDAAARWRRGAE